MAYKGTVFKVKSKSLILMTGDFEFKEIKKRQPAQVGQEIIFHDSDLLRPARKRLLAVVASLLIIVFFSATMLRDVMVPDVYAYVGMDINPSFELALDKNHTVIQAIPRNSDAENILPNAEIKGLYIDKAINIVIKACYDSGYINDSNSDIVITTTLESDAGINDDLESLEDKVLSSARNELEKGEKTEKEANIYVVRVDSGERSKALKQDVSPGRYYLWNKAKETDSDLTLDKVKSQTISDTLKSNNKLKTTLEDNSVKKWNKGKSQSSNKKPKEKDKEKENKQGNNNSRQTSLNGNAKGQNQGENKGNAAAKNTTGPDKEIEDEETDKKLPSEPSQKKDKDESKNKDNSKSPSNNKSQENKIKFKDKNKDNDNKSNLKNQQKQNKEVKEKDLQKVQNRWLTLKLYK